MEKQLVIGVLGGMGTFATLHLFKRYAELFPAEKEWDRPRIVIDNRCTMPSRVRAWLYGEGTDRLVDEMTESLGNLLSAGCTRIILACNTSHLFLPRIMDRLPALRDVLVHIVDTCVDAIQAESVPEVYLLGTEGTIESRIYQNALVARGVRCDEPPPALYPKVRECIEAVKQDRYSEDVVSTFVSLVSAKRRCILGCTELPVLYRRFQREIDARTGVRFYDPADLALMKIRDEFLAAKREGGTP